MFDSSIGQSIRGRKGRNFQLNTFGKKLFIINNYAPIQITEAMFCVKAYLNFIPHNVFFL